LTKKIVRGLARLQIVVVPLRVNVNLKTATLEALIARRKVGHVCSSAIRGSIDACKSSATEKDYQNIVKNTVSLGAVKMLCKNVRLQDDYGF
jgi:hypothetical protein